MSDEAIRELLRQEALTTREVADAFGVSLGRAYRRLWDVPGLETQVYCGLRIWALRGRLPRNPATLESFPLEAW